MARSEDAPVAIPSKTRCPECGGEPTDESARRRQLSDLGYLHQDIGFTCEECGEQWSSGVPVGEFDRPEMADDLWCDSCDDEWMLVHRVQAGRGAASVTLHLKCPDSECHHFDTVRRSPDDQSVALVGYPQITGKTEGAKPYGYPDEQ